MIRLAEKSMKILIDDGLQSRVGTGIGNYAAYLADSLAAMPDTAVTREAFAADGSRPRARLAYLSYLASADYRRKLEGFDVVHYANYAMPRRLPKNVISAVTVHDLTAFCHPETLPPAYAAYNRFMVKRAMKKADLIFTVSEAVRAEIAARFPHAAHRVLTVYPGHYSGLTDLAIAKAYESPSLAGLTAGRFFLFVGALEKRKNLGVLIEAFARFRWENPSCHDFKLVLAGREGYGAEAYHSMIKSTPVSGDILCPGYLPTADIAKLYREAAAFVFPSVYEGFGSPQTECMAMGTPMLLGDIPTNREVSGELAAYFPPHDSTALAVLLQKVAAGELSAHPHASERLAAFTWSAAATAVWEAYLSALAKK